VATSDETQGQATKPDKDESKDFVEHLRTVHFALIATCLALVVVVLGSSSERLSKASRQLDLISETAAALKSSWIQEARKEFVASADECVSFADREVHGFVTAPGQHSLPPSLVFAVEPSGKKVYLASWFKKSPVGIPSLVLPTTLAQFREIWDARIMFVCPTQLSQESVSMSVKDFMNFPASNGLMVNEAVLNDRFPIGAFRLAQSSDNPDFLNVFDVTEYRTQTLRVRDVLRNKLPKEELPHRDFNEAFSELDQATTGVQEEASLKLLKSIVELQRKNASEFFEAFGQKFPSESASRWGSLIVIGIQFYFWLHFSEYRKRPVGPLQTAWIGSYTTAAARFLFCTTALAAPVGVIVFVCIKAGLLSDMPIRNAILCSVAATLSLFFSLLTAKEYFKQETVTPTNR
jgi:hypothetical protein